MESPSIDSTAQRIENRVAQFMCRAGFPRHSATTIVGLSGGADSVALLAILTRLGHQCVAAHCNFHLRGAESDRDQQHAMAIATQLGAEFKCVHFDTRSVMTQRGISLEMAARDLRYEWFRQLSHEYGNVPIAIAHHRDDNIETMFLNLLRGTGIHGARGMLPVNGNIIRPLLCCSRSMIEDYLRAIGLDYITDSSNNVNDVARNRLRNIVLPTLYQEFPDAAEALERSMSVLADNERLITHAADCAAKRYITGRILHLKQLMAECGDAAHAILYEILSPSGFNSTQVNDLLSAASHPGARIYSRSHMIEIGRDTAHITPMDESSSSGRPPYINSKFITPDKFQPERNPVMAWFDASAVDPDTPLILRPWRHGDRLKPFGMKGSRLLSDIFTDAKLSPEAKRRIWVLTTHQDEILWIPGLRASRLYPVTSQSTQILHLTMADECGASIPGLITLQYND